MKTAPRLEEAKELALLPFSTCARDKITLVKENHVKKNDQAPWGGLDIPPVHQGYMQKKAHCAITFAKSASEQPASIKVLAGK